MAGKPCNHFHAATSIDPQQMHLADGCSRGLAQWQLYLQPAKWTSCCLPAHTIRQNIPIRPQASFCQTPPVQENAIGPTSGPDRTQPGPRSAPHAAPIRSSLLDKHLSHGPHWKPGLVKFFVHSFSMESHDDRASHGFQQNFLSSCHSMPWHGGIVGGLT